MRIRESTLKKDNEMDKKKKEKLLSVMNVDYMSSEDEEYTGRKKTYVVRPLQWRSESLTHNFGVLDRRHENGLSQRSWNQMIDRREGEPSSRAAPKGAPRFALKQNNS